MTRTEQIFFSISLLSLLLLNSCTVVDFQKLKTDNPYVGFCQGMDCVLFLEEVDEGNMKGRLYLDSGDVMAVPVAFTTDVKRNGKGCLRIGDRRMNLKLSVTEDAVQGRLRAARKTALFSLQLQRVEEYPFRAMYKEPFYEVAVDSGRVYAHGVSGYWSSYPDTREDFGTIYLKKVKYLASTRDLDLDMDLYYPKESEKQKRPLLLLIHGGAFYNGDKQDTGYPELGRHFAELGYVVASINYRLGFRPLAANVDCAGFRALQDAHAAVCYLMANADEFGIDTASIFAAGSSAGAITALNLAFMRNENRPETVAKSDIGNIDAVSGANDRDFQVKAVVNMWGALHDADMLKNSKSTAVLSFHGDADRIVPYAFGYPFDNVLEPYKRKIIESLPKFLQFVVELEKKWSKNSIPFNHWVFNPMYGSAAIHEKAAALGMRSEMHTCQGCGHSLHVDEKGELSDYFRDTILPDMTRFLYEELIGGVKVEITRAEADGRWFEAAGARNIAELHWQVEGGCVVGENDHKVKVMLFSDAPRHSVTACGKYKTGVEFRETTESF